MRHLNVKLDDADWRAFEALHKVLQKRRRHLVTLSSTLRLVIKVGLEAQEAVVTKAAAAPIAPPTGPRAHWDKHVAQSVKDAAQLRDERKALHRRFDLHCDQRNLSPHDFIEQMAELDETLSSAALHAWYYEGKLPAEGDGADRIVEAVRRWLEDADGRFGSGTMAPRRRRAR
jgi:hypothetical protein